MNKLVSPKLLTDVEALELIYGPPPSTLSEADMRDYQLWMADLIEKTRAVFLAAEMGLGKTGATLLAITRALLSGKVKHVLIVAPLRVAEETWPEEIAKWAFARHLRYRVVTGTQDQRRAALKFGPVDVTIVNRENLRWLYSIIGTRNWPWTFVVYDEASRLKGGQTHTESQRLSELGVLNRVRHKLDYLVELSGTPASNGLIDLWGPIYAIDNGKRLGTSITAYRNRWFREDRYTRRWEPLPHAHGEITERLQDVFFSLREEDYLTLPPLIERNHEVTMSPRDLARYRNFEREMAIQLHNRWNEPEIVEAANRGVLTGKLLQFANGGMYLEDESVAHIHDLKLDALESIVQEAMGRPLLVAYSFKFDRIRIKKRFPFARFFGENPNDKRDWDAGRIKMLVTHPQSAGHGLNFQHGSNIAVWYGLTWSLELYRQFIKRLHRSGQKEERVFLHRIITRKTVDETILPLLMSRDATQNRITDAVRVRIKRARVA